MAAPRPLLEGFGPFTQAAETKFGEQLLWRHRVQMLDDSAAHPHHRRPGIASGRVNGRDVLPLFQ